MRNGTVSTTTQHNTGAGAGQQHVKSEKMDMKAFRSMSTLEIGSSVSKW